MATLDATTSLWLIHCKLFSLLTLHIQVHFLCIARTQSLVEVYHVDIIRISNRQMLFQNEHADGGWCYWSAENCSKMLHSWCGVADGVKWELNWNVYRIKWDTSYIVHVHWHADISITITIGFVAKLFRIFEKDFASSNLYFHVCAFKRNKIPNPYFLEWNSKFNWNCNKYLNLFRYDKKCTGVFEPMTTML